jgi:16S rRNA (guanine966-N2)-methyltransferase
MRITGGSLSGRQVTVPPGVIRPAMDRMRESVFSILEPMDGLRFLDLFAGSGIMSLEALSRRAGSATLVERDPRKRVVIARNLELVDPELTTLIITPAERYVLRCRERFDLVFMDPPFDYRFKADLISRIERRGLVAVGGRLIIHYPAPESLPDRFGPLVMDDERKYGGSMVRFYSRTD